MTEMATTADRQTDMAPRRRARTSLVTASSGYRLSLGSLQDVQGAAVADNTKRGYGLHWKQFTKWCQENGHESLPAAPHTVAEYLKDHAELADETTGEYLYAPGTISCWLSSINKAHATAKLPVPGTDPEVSLTMAGIRRLRIHTEDRKAPLMLDDLRNTVQGIEMHSWPHGVIGHRDAALIVLGFVGAYRRSELADIFLGDVTRHHNDGLHIYTRRSKTDQEGRGAVKALPFGANTMTCAPCAFVRWVRVLAAAENGRAAAMTAVRDSNVTSHVCQESLPALHAATPLFSPVMKNGSIKPRPISGNVVNDVVKRRLEDIGIASGPYGAHSLRAGFVTEALRAGATHHEIMRQTWHKDATTVEIYSRDYDPLAHNAVTRIRL